jgi:HlyD family secretion protein
MGKVFKIVLILLTLLAVAGLSGCSKSQTSPSTTSPGLPPAANQANLIPVGSVPGQPEGNKSLASTPVKPKNSLRGSGVIGVSVYSNLNFGSSGQISVINVKAGDKVIKGKELAKLDTLTLEATVSAAKVTLNQAKISQIQAESNLASAQLNLEKIEAVKKIQDDITDAKWNLKIIQMQANEARTYDSSFSSADWSSTITDAQNILTRQENKLADLLKNKEYSDYIYAYGQEYDRMVVEDAKIKQLAVESARLNYQNAQDIVDLAQKNLDLAKKQLDDATIKAPFDGLVAEVNQNPGDILSAPAALKDPVIYMIDPGSLELVVGVNELDVPKIKIGQNVTVKVDAFPDKKVEGVISKISPVPTLQGSITDYNVTITFAAPESLSVKVGMNASALISVE